jgi:hypothetical protein
MATPLLSSPRKQGELMPDGTPNPRSRYARIFDIAIAATIGGLLGWFLAMNNLVSGVGSIVVDKIHASRIIVSGNTGTVNIDGHTGISLNRDDDAAALLWFYEPGTGDPGTGDPGVSIVEAPPKKVAPAKQEAPAIKEAAPKEQAPPKAAEPAKE